MTHSLPPEVAVLIVSPQRQNSSESSVGHDFEGKKPMSDTWRVPYRFLEKTVDLLLKIYTWYTLTLALTLTQ